MSDIAINGFYEDRVCRTRYMESILGQIREDHKELTLLCNMIKNGPLTKYCEDEFLRLISWLKVGLIIFKGLRQRGIEGLFSGEIDAIEKDVQDKERILGSKFKIFHGAPFPEQKPIARISFTP